MIKKIAIRIIILVIILISINYIYKYSFLEQDIQRHSAVINLVRAVPNEIDIIYLAESSNMAIRGNDIDKRPISAFVADHFPTLKVIDITKPASHAGIYKVLLENIPDSSNVKTVIVTLNLRSFNAQWIYSELETPLRKSMVLLKSYPPIINRFLLSFKAYDIKTDKEREQQFKRKWKKDKFNLPFEFQFENVIEWDQYMWKSGIKNPDGTKNQQLTELACHYIKAYAFQIDTLSNPRIEDFNAIVKLAEARGWNLLFNLLPENSEKAEQLVGEELLYLMNENSELLQQYYQSRGVKVVNGLHEVEDEQFIDQDWTTEHYAEKGRKIVAQHVAEAVKDFHPGKFVEIEYSDKIQTSFLNNCDGQVVWGQMQTITDEMAFSGTKSSKTGNENDFSITFEYPLKQLPDSSKNNVSVSFKVNKESLDRKGQLVIQANGANFKNYWKGIDLNQQIHKANSWEDFHQTIPIPDSIKQADIIKIFLYNPSDEIIFIDDFQIDFE
ncbi:MAG: DUF4843 domain-containing protein [Bacteroidota bacterium]